MSSVLTNYVLVLTNYTIFQNFELGKLGKLDVLINQNSILAE